MAQTANPIDIYLEIGQKRTFAGAVAWPGWCRSGRDEATALQALLDYGSRYAHVLHTTHIKFQAPTDIVAFTVVERLTGNTTTDFGAPSIAPTSDKQPVDDAELQRFQTLLKVYWRVLDKAVAAAAGKELRKGPRGGGREIDGIMGHVLDAEAGYLAHLAWKQKQTKKDPSEKAVQIHQAVLDALTASAHGETPTKGPRGGVIWAPRYFVRRVAWHVLDHVWEIEDRSTE